MQRTYKLAEIPNPTDILRKAGYAYFRDPQSGQESFVLRLTPEFYPRFHLYVESTTETITFNLHLDQKQPSYGEHTKHSGEYEGPVLAKELQRLHTWVQAVRTQPRQDTSERDPITQKTSSQKTIAGALFRAWRKLFNRLT